MEHTHSFLSGYNKTDREITSAKSNRLFNYYIAVVFLMVLLAPRIFYAQSDRDATIAYIGADLLVLIENNISNKEAVGVGNDLQQLNALYNLSDPQYQLAGRQGMKGHQASQIAKDIGLNLKLQYFVNYDQEFGEPQPIDDNAVGNRSRFGVEWELLQNGLIGNQRKAKELRYQEELETLKYDLAKNDERLFFRYNIIIYLFNEAKIKLLQESKAQVIKEIELLYQVYFLKGILFEEILKAKSRLDQMKVQLENYATYNRTIANTLDMTLIDGKFNYDDLPVLEINLDYLIEDETGRQLLDSLTNLEKQIQSTRNKAIDDVSLKLHAYQYLGSSNSFDWKDRSSVSAGVSLTVPTELIFDGRARKRLYQERTRERVKFDNYEHINEKTEIINYYYEYNYKLKTFMEYVYKDMLYQERVRIETVNHKDFTDIHRSLKILRDMDAMRSIRLETIDLKQQMYLLLLKIYANTHYRSILPAVKPIDVAAFYQRLPAKRSIVLGPKILKEYNARFVVHYLLSNGIEKLIIEPGQAVSKEMKNLLIENNIEIVSMAKGRQMTQSADGIDWHIDYAMVEHDYDGVKIDFTDASTPQEIEQFVLTQMERIEKSNGDISIQIGKGLPAEFVSTLLRRTDYLTIKMDKPSDLDYLRKIANISEEKGKFGISLKANAFKDRMELEAYIDMIHSLYGVEHVVIDDLDDYMSLDTKTMANME